MPRQRLQVDTGINPVELRPAAAPVDTFVHTAAGQQTEQLAQGLAALSPALGRFSDVLIEKQAKTDYEAGQQKARELSESAKSFKEAVQAGKITPNQSPWFMAGLKEQFGRVAADRMNFEFLTAAAKDENLQTTTDPKDFDAFYSKFQGQWQQDNLDPKTRDRFFEKGFGSKSDAYLADAQREFAAQLAGRVVKFAGDGHFAEVMNSVITEKGRGTSAEAQGASLTALNDAAVARGMGGHLVNQMTIDAVVAAARRTNDASILDILDHVGSGPQTSKGRSSLATTRYGATMVEKAQSDIAAELQAKNNREYENGQRAHAKATEALFGEAITALDNSNDPHNVDLTNIRTRMESIAPEKIPLLYQIQDAYSDRTVADSPLPVAAAFRRVWTQNPGESPTTEEDGAVLLAHRQISVKSYRELLTDIRTRDHEGGTFENDKLLAQGQRQIRAMFVAEYGESSADQRERAEEAVDEFSMRYIRWKQGAGKDANDLQRREFINNARHEVFVAKSGSMDASNFERIPNANLRPVPADPKKALVTDPSNIMLLDGEVRGLMVHSRNALSAHALAILQYAGVPPNIKAIREFIEQQRQFIPTFVSPDSTH